MGLFSTAVQMYVNVITLILCLITVLWQLQKPIGVYALIDEESKFPKATASSLLEKLRKHLIKHPYIKKDKSKEPKFTIQHYAGPVSAIIIGVQTAFSEDRGLRFLKYED